MRIYKYFIFVFILFFSLPAAFSQDLKKDEIVVIGGEDFIMHIVQPGETIFSLARKYEVESRELIRHNPNLLQGLKTGEVLRIPFNGDVEETEEISVQEVEPTFITHKIKRRETPYFISKKYGISIDDIYKYNPDLKKFKRGVKIRIPQFEEPVSEAEDITEVLPEGERVEIPSGSDFIEHRVRPDETLFSLSKKYSRSISEILHYNPDAQPLKIGMLIRLPEGRSEFSGSPDSERQGDFYIHMIETGETLYGLTKTYHISESELKELNPLLKTEFPAGAQIIIPVTNIPEIEVAPINDEAFVRHEVEKGETLYRLSTEYGLKVAEIKKANPSLHGRDGLRWGETILIPKKTEREPVIITDEEEEVAGRPEEEFYEVEAIVEVPEGCRPGDHRGFFFDTYHVGLLLPLFLEANDTLNIKPVVTDSLLVDEIYEVGEMGDTIEQEYTTGEQAWQFYWRSEDFLHLYEGVLVAIDSMRNKGMNVELHVFDTKLDKHIVDSLIATDEFLRLDLIIGPIVGNLQSPVAEFAFKNRIPMVSPLSQDARLIDTNPYYFQVNPSREFLIQKTSDYIADRYYDSNFIVLEIGNPGKPESLLVDMCREKLYNTGYYRDISEVPFRIYNFNQLGSHGLPRILSETRENVFIVPSYIEGEVSVAVSNINNNTPDYDITVIGNSRYSSFESIDQEHFHNVGLKYFYPYRTDYTSSGTISFISKFRKYFHAEPNQYSMQGFDIAFFFLTAFWEHGRNFYDCLPYMDVELTQGNYKFEKVSRFGGYMNQGVTLITYQKDYTVTTEKLTGKIRYVYK